MSETIKSHFILTSGIVAIIFAIATAYPTYTLSEIIVGGFAGFLIGFIIEAITFGLKN